MIRMILFDLGGVVVTIPNEKYYSYLSKLSGLSESEVHMRIAIDTAPFERGDITPNKFRQIVADDLGIRRKDVSWRTYFRKIARLNMGTASLVRRLAKNYPVSFLSNVDKARYHTGVKYILKDLMPLFKYTFVSYKLKAVKPSPLIYRRVLSKMRLRPEEVVFVDNDVHNVYGARKLGIKAIHFTSVQLLEKELKGMGLKF